jgi:hypothetical protein
MRTEDQKPSLVPNFDVTVYLVLDHFGRLGSAYRETDEEQADRESVIDNMLHGEYNNPKRVVAFNTAEKWSFRCLRGCRLGSSEACLQSGSGTARLHAIIL